MAAAFRRILNDAKNDTDATYNHKFTYLAKNSPPSPTYTPLHSSAYIQHGGKLLPSGAPLTPAMIVTTKGRSCRSTLKNHLRSRYGFWIRLTDYQTADVQNVTTYKITRGFDSMSHYTS